MLTQQYLFRMCEFMCYLLTGFHKLASVIHWLSPILKPREHFYMAVALLCYIASEYCLNKVTYFFHIYYYIIS